MGLTTRQVRNLEMKGMPHDKGKGNQKSYPVPDAFLWYIEYQKRLNETGEPSQLDRAKLRKAEADADLAELQLQQRRGELLERAYVVDEFDRILSNLRQRILAMGARYGDEVVGLKTAKLGTKTLDRIGGDLLTVLRSTYDEDAEAAA